MGTWLVTATGLEEHPAEDIDALLQRDEGFVWMDVPELDATSERVLREVLHAHPMLISACRERNFVPTVHAYEEHCSSSCTLPCQASRATCTCSSSTSWWGRATS